jgi:hypothetical protein
MKRADRAGQCGIVVHNAARTKISNPWTPFLIQQDIRWLQITMNDIFMMHIPHSEDQTGDNDAHARGRPERGQSPEFTLCSSSLTDPLAANST